jgi:hypothetical protein
VLRRIFGPKRGKWREAGEDCLMRSFITCKLHQILLGYKINEDKVGEPYNTHGRGEICT